MGNSITDYKIIIEDDRTLVLESLSCAIEGLAKICGDTVLNCEDARLHEIDDNLEKAGQAIERLKGWYARHP